MNHDPKMIGKDKDHLVISSFHRQYFVFRSATQEIDDLLCVLSFATKISLNLSLVGEITIFTQNNRKQIIQ
jgi:hypothetical protein